MPTNLPTGTATNSVKINDNHSALQSLPRFTPNVNDVNESIVLRANDTDSSSPPTVQFSAAEIINGNNIPSSSQNRPDATKFLNCEDAGDWPASLHTQFVQYLVEKGPKKLILSEYPATKNRKFSNRFYNRVLDNGKTIPRDWLIYSPKNNSVYCFCCRLFGSNKATKFANVDGYSDWIHITTSLKKHETSQPHMKAYLCWKSFETNLKSHNTIDANMQNLLDIEMQSWKEVLKRIVTIVSFLGTQSLAFRGSSDNLFEENNGNFLQLIKAVAKFDFVQANHLRKIKDQETRNMYLSKSIQNEIINMIAGAVRNKILLMINDAKYFSIIVDATPDLSHTEQITLIIRFVHKTPENKIEIREHFMGFLVAKGTTGQSLMDLLLSELNRLGLRIENCRGQGYDNGSNMKGKNIGMQALIKEIEPRAFYVPCASHSLNLVVNDAVKTSLEGVKFFDIVQQIYVFFSRSTSRWNIFKKYVSGLTVKPLSETRWESRIDAIKPLKRQLAEINEALIEAGEVGDAETKVMAESLSNKILEFKFICSLLIWHDILEKNKVTSKYLQGPKQDLSTAVDILRSTKKFLKKMRSEKKFNEYVTAASEMAKALDVASEFPPSSSIRSRIKKRLHTYEGRDEPVLEPREKFKIEFFYSVLDHAIASTTDRFELLQAYSENFNFLYDIHGLATVAPEKLEEFCSKLQAALTDKSGVSDINSNELSSELKMLCNLIPAESGPLQALELIHSKYLTNVFPQTVNSLHILLTIPVTVASGERSFSKLKIIKNYLRTTMLQERLVSLATMSIEKKIVETLNYDDLIDTFAKLKARRVDFS